MIANEDVPPTSVKHTPQQALKAVNLTPVYAYTKCLNTAFLILPWLYVSMNSCFGSNGSIIPVIASESNNNYGSCNLFKVYLGKKTLEGHLISFSITWKNGFEARFEGNQLK